MAPKHRVVIRHHYRARDDLPYHINNQYTVREGAISSASVAGLVYVDYRISEWSVLPDGWLCHNWKYLAIHELFERAAMLKAGFNRTLPPADQRRIYKRAHESIATPAEKRAVLADGGNWRLYTPHMDGLLSHIEHSSYGRPPPDPFIEAEVALKV